METVPRLVDILPDKMPDHWEDTEVPFAFKKMLPNTQAVAYRRRDGLRVLVSIDEYDEETGVWLHISVSRRNRLPNWQELKEVKGFFLGSEIVAIQVLAPDSHWINIHKNCLHLFSRIDGDTIPPNVWNHS